MSHNGVFYPRMSKKPPFTVEAPGYEHIDGETVPRRNVSHGEKLLARPDDTIYTVFDIVERAAQRFGNARCMGSRDLIKVHCETRKAKKMVNGREQEVDKQWTYFELSEYRYMSFSDYEKLILQVGAGLRKLGLQKGDKIHLYAATRYVNPPKRPLVATHAKDLKAHIGWRLCTALPHSRCLS
jgi:long-chain acyl-CoA synthetase